VHHCPRFPTISRRRAFPVQNRARLKRSRQSKPLAQKKRTNVRILILHNNLITFSFVNSWSFSIILLFQSKTLKELKVYLVFLTSVILEKESHSYAIILIDNFLNYSIVNKIVFYRYFFSILEVICRSSNPPADVAGKVGGGRHKNKCPFFFVADWRADNSMKEWPPAGGTITVES
jgi:hypothetical protein